MKNILLLLLAIYAALAMMFMLGRHSVTAQPAPIVNKEPVIDNQIVNPVVDSTVDQPHAWMWSAPENVNSEDNTNQFDIAPCWPAEDQNGCGENMNTNGAVPVSPYDKRF